MTICDVTCYTVPTDPRAAFSPARFCCQCNTHGMTDFAPAYSAGDLCPVGKVERAVEVGLAKIAAAAGASGHSSKKA